MLLVLLAAAGCSGMRNVPMKAFHDIDIPDGEFLHYFSYTGNEKDSDIYFVTRKETGVNGGTVYRIYMVNISVSGGKKLPENYRDWPSSFLIDPIAGTVLEMKMTMDTDTSIYKNNENQPFPYSWNFKRSLDGRYVDFNMKTIKGRQSAESRYHFKVNPLFPVWENISLGFFSPRFMDLSSHGIIYSIAPFLVKEPLPFSFRCVAIETIKTRAGSFLTTMVAIAMADPFLEKIMEPFTKQKTGIWVENSGRRVIAKVELMDNVTELEEISNINSK